MNKGDMADRGAAGAPMTPGVLDGIRVVDWTVYHQGSAGGQILADLGADVIHVEQRGLGDSVRGVTSIFGISMVLPTGHITVCEDLNRNKRSLSLDLAKPKGRELMYRLVEKSDVFLTNFRTRAVKKLGLDYETLAARNKRLIYGQATSFGERGPEKDNAGFELMGYARSAALLGCGEKGWPPTPMTMGLGDRTGGTFLAFGALAALLVRERTGRGQYFATSLLGGMIYLQAATIFSALLTGRDFRANRRESAGNPLYNYYRCGDGDWIALGVCVDTQRYWPDFCDLIGRPELRDDPRFATDQQRLTHCEELAAVLDEVFATKPYSEWARELRRKGDLIFSKVNDQTDLANDPQVAENGYLVPFDDPVLGPIKHVALPINFSETPARIKRRAPECGEHTEEILVGDLGLSWEEVATLQEEEVV